MQMARRHDKVFPAAYARPVTMAGLEQARLGSAPDSWGVWFPDAPGQVPPGRFLDEIARAGYRYVELGPWGYLPTEPGPLAEQLAAHGLTLSGGTVGGALHHPDQWEPVRAEARSVAALVAALGARHLVFLPAMYRDLSSGAPLEARELGADGWRLLTDRMQALGTELAGDLGVRLVLHPHADSHLETPEQIERFLTDTDPDAVGLCLDTGHVAYRHGDNAAIVRRFAERIEYIHFKQVDPAVLATVTEQDLGFAQAVRLGVTCEPPAGVPTVESLAAAFALLPADIFVIVEQDMFGCSPDRPFPIAQRTARYLYSCGIGAARAEPTGEGEAS